MDKANVVTQLPTIHREDFPRLLRQVADEIEADDNKPSEIVIITRGTECETDGGVDLEHTWIDVWSRGGIAESLSGMLGILEHAKLRLFEMGRPDDG